MKEYLIHSGNFKSQCDLQLGSVKNDINSLNSQDEEGSKVFLSYGHYACSSLVKSPMIHFIFIHGAMEYHGHHYPLFEYLLKTFKEHCLISCYDLAGHGYSGGTRGHIDDFSTYVDDTKNFYFLAKEFSQSLPTQSLVTEKEKKLEEKKLEEKKLEEKKIQRFFIAHSLGGMISIKTIVDELAEEVEKKEILGLILSNPCIKPKIHFPKAILSLLRKTQVLLPKLRLPSPNRGQHITRDRQRAISFNTDELINHFVTLGMGKAIWDTVEEILPYSYFVNLPTLFLLSTDDHVVDCEITKLFATGINKNFQQLHFFQGAKHDLFNEINREEVFHEIAHFVRYPQGEDQSNFREDERTALGEE